MRTRTLFIVAAALVGSALSASCSDDGIEPPPATTSGGGEGGAGASGGEGGAGGDGASGGEGGAGGEGGGITGADACPGDPYDIGVGDTLELPGTTAGLTGDYASFCGIGSASGPESVYALTATGSGTMRISVAGSNGLNAVLYAQESCGDPSLGSFINCQDEGDLEEAFAFDAQEGQVYYVFVDGRDATAGDYVLTASLEPPICGDGVINETIEDCDFGDTNPGDGCDPTCQFEPPSDDSDTCQGELYQVDPGAPFTITSFTTGYTDDYTSCGAAVGAPDRVFALFVSAGGTLNVSLPNLGVPGGGFDGVLAAWSPTCSPGVVTMPPYLGCSDSALAAETEELSFPVTAGTVYFVVVDGYANYSYGNFQLSVSLD